MKSIKGIFIALVVSILFGLSAANAKGESLTFGEIKLPKRSGVYTTEKTKEKTEKGLQYIKTYSAVDNLTGGGRAVSARVVGPEGTSSWISAPKNQLASWTEDKTKVTGGYYLQLKATKSTLATVSYSGTWYLDDAIVGQ